MAEEAKEIPNICAICGTSTRDYFYKDKRYCPKCYPKFIKKMKRKELEELEWEIKDNYGSQGHSYYDDYEWKLINRELGNKNYKKFWRVSYLTISIAIILPLIAIVISVIALFKS